jgi:MFS family permease
VLTGARWLAGGLGHPAWMSLLTDIVPLDLRRLYISRRMLGMAAVAAIVAPLAGLFVRFAGGVSSVGAFQWLFLIAFGFGAVSTVFYSRIEEPPHPAGHARPRGSTRAMLRDRGFMRFLTGTLVLHSSTMIAGPFFAAYFVRNLGATATLVGALATVEAVSSVLGQYAAGRLAVRRGSIWLLKVSMFLVPLLPLLWAASTRPWQPLVPALLGGAAWAAFNLASFNLLLDYAPEENLPRYAATHQSAVLASSLIGPVIGTAIVAAYGLRAAMLVSAAGRVVALGVMAWPGAVETSPHASASVAGIVIEPSDAADTTDTAGSGRGVP